LGWVKNGLKCLTTIIKKNLFKEEKRECNFNGDYQAINTNYENFKLRVVFPQ